MRPAGIAPVDRVEKIAELRRRDRNGAIRRARPDEPAMLEPLGVKRQADAVVPKNFDHVAATAAKNEKIAGVRICGAPHIRTYVSGVDMCRRGLGAADSAAI